MAKLEYKLVVTVPVYNEGPYVLETLKSLAAQTHSDFRVLVADNASTDQTESICREFCASDERFHYVRHDSNLGATANFKYCFESTDSELFMWLGGHDMLHPEFLAEACLRMDTDPSLSLVYSHTQWIDENNQSIGRSNGGNYVFEEPLSSPARFLRLLNALDRCEAINQIIRRKFVDLPFKPVVSADLVFLCHLAAHGPFARIDRPLYIRREISKRTSTMMERITGQRVEPEYKELAAFFTESICSHRNILPSEKGQLITDTLAWLNKRFSIFTPPALASASELSRVADAPAPLFSVVMPVYNRERYVQKAIESVLAQNDVDFELVVVDDGSSDRSVEIIQSIRDPRLRLFRNNHSGGAAARNRGIAEARGTFIVWIDSDDLQAPGALAVLRQAIAATPDGDVFYGDLEIFDDDQPGRVHHTQYPDYYQKSILPLLVRGNCLPNPGTAVRKALYAKHGDYDVTFRRCHDYEVWTRLADSAVFKKVDSILCHWRQHTESLSSTQSREFEGKVVQGAFERYPVSRLFPELADDQAGYAEACWRMVDILKQFAEYVPALHMAYKAAALGRADAEAVAELRTLAAGRFTPLFSVILTTYNRPKLLRDALSSVAGQTLQDVEVILINDHGCPVESVIADYTMPITYIFQGTNQGLSAARNAGLKLARGRYIVYLDDDDVYLPEHLQVLAEAFEKHPSSVIYTGVEYVSERLEGGKRIEMARAQPFKHEVFDRDQLFVQNYIPVNTWAHPLYMLDEVGSFDVTLTAFEDWDMLLRLATRYDFLHVPRVTSEVHTRLPGAGGDHMLGREQNKFPALYLELYRRYAGSSSKALQAGREQMLERLGVPVDKHAGKPVIEKWLSERLPTAVQSRLIAERLESAHGGVVLGVLVIDSGGDQEALTATVNSLGNQHHLYASVNIVAMTVLDVPPTCGEETLHYVRLDERGLVEQVNDAVASLEADWFMLVTAGTEFTQSGLLVAALDLQAAPGCRAVYGDELLLQDEGEVGLALRPGLNLDMILSLPSVMSRHWLFNRELWQGNGGFDEAAGKAFELDYILKLVQAHGLEGLGHISEPLLKAQAPVLANCADERGVIVRHLNARGYAHADISATKAGRYEIYYGHEQWGRVSILVSALSGLAKVRRCVESILEKTQYPSYEVLVLDYGLSDRALASWLQGIDQLGVDALKVVRVPQGLSQAQARNMAAEHAGGDYLLWLDAGVAVLSSNWLHELMNHAMRPEVGAVGSKLVAGDGKIVNGGLVLGFNGPVGAVGVGQPLESPGYLQRLQIDQNHTALNGQCLLLRSSLFAEVGGFDELPELAPWLDVDLCLRLFSAGYFNVWTPRASLLITHDAGPLPTSEQEDAMYDRWLPLLARDPLYNPSFKLDAVEEFSLAPSLLSWNPLSSWQPLPRVLAHPADRFGCGHYRVINPLNALSEHAIVDGVLAWGHLSLTELERFKPDTIVLQRQVGREQIESMRRMKAFSQAFKVYELDDYLPNLPLKSVHRRGMPKDILRSLRRGLGYVDRFVVSTEALADAFSGLHGDIQVVHNRLDPRQWRGLGGERRRSNKPRVGWAGGVSHTGDLEMILDVVRELASEVEWVFLGMCPDKLRPYVHEFHAGVCIQDYPQKLAQLDLDLALAPVEQNLFNECKSNLRLLEYGACGFPVVCSDLPCYAGDLPVTRVRNRFKDWVDAIRMHLADLEETARCGDRLREAVMSEWVLEGDKLELWRKAWLMS